MPDDFCACGHPRSDHSLTGHCVGHMCPCVKFRSVKAETPVPDDKPKETCCQEADRIVGGDRRAEYGPVSEGLTRTALIWSGILGVTVTPEQVCLCMVGLKVSRECHKHGRDSLVDICGYARVLELYHEEKTKTCPQPTPKDNSSQSKDWKPVKATMCEAPGWEGIPKECTDPKEYE